MARVLLADQSVIVKLNLAEMFLALQKSVTVPLADVCAVSVVDRPWDGLPPLVLGPEVMSVGPSLSCTATGDRW